eukprot:GEZU01025565.1.p1 GENE.GEZU01025565.1~~GEZU01025565.1.p1  ORF type:complete len:181 (+),score=17.12 GEZU01025565.1:108-650(+)
MYVHTKVFVEPGTPLGFKLVREARAFLLNESSSTNEDRATVLAPCPHDGVCPMTNTKSWCHFSQRLERETFQRITKSGLTMPYEDEKFSKGSLCTLLTRGRALFPGRSRQEDTSSWICARLRPPSSVRPLAMQWDAREAMPLLARRSGPTCSPSIAARQHTQAFPTTMKTMPKQLHTTTN